MRLKIATFEDIRAHSDAIHHPASKTSWPETLSLPDLTVRDISDEYLELRDAILAPEGGVVWRGHWLAHDVLYMPPEWHTRPFRPGNLDPFTNTIEIADHNLVPDTHIEPPAMLCDSRLAAINFGHFAHDFMPYGAMYRRVRAAIPEARPLLHAMSWESQKRLIAAVFGLPYAECARIGQVTAVRRLLVPRRQSMLERPEWSISFAGLRAARDLALAGMGIQPATAAAPVLLHRLQNLEYLRHHNMVQGRDYTNLAELSMAMLESGLVGLEPGRVGIEITARLLSGAPQVVGVHGANLGNILFCPPGARVYELRAADGNWRDYEVMAGVLGHRFHAVYQPRPAPGERPAIDLTALASLLQAAE